MALVAIQGIYEENVGAPLVVALFHAGADHAGADLQSLKPIQLGIRKQLWQ